MLNGFKNLIESPQKLFPPLWLINKSLNKKQFLMSMRKSATEFAVFIFRTIEELKLVREKPALYEVVFDFDPEWEKKSREVNSR